MKTRTRRALIGLAILLAVGTAAALILNALNSNIALYITPTEVVAGKHPQGKMFRIGGMVKAGSVQRDGLDVNFVLTDTAHDVNVRYRGILPDLFKEGQGAVVQGKLEGGVFAASEVLAKHDENYMPPEAKAALDAAQNAKVQKAQP
jgi:cytochrome c-type biogenesis protein CcmE